MRAWFRFGAGGECYDVSAAMRHWLRLPRAAFLVHNWTLRIHPDDRDQIRRMADILQRNEVPAPCAIRWISLQQEIITTDLRILVRRYADTGAPQCFIGRLTRLRPSQETAAS